jgi:hypothetical protein
MTTEYQIRRRFKSNPASNDPALQICLTSKYDHEAGPSDLPPEPYKDTAGNYVFKTLVENVTIANAALDDLDPVIENHPSVV